MIHETNFNLCIYSIISFLSFLRDGTVAEGSCQLLTSTQNDEDISTIFTNSLRDMQYHHLGDPLLKTAFKIAVQMAFMEASRKLEKSQAVLAVQLLIDGQTELAELIENDYYCRLLGIEANRRLKLPKTEIFDLTVKSVFNCLQTEYKEAYLQKDMREKPLCDMYTTYTTFLIRREKQLFDSDTYATLMIILDKYNDLTSEAQKDICNRNEPIAKCIVEKAQQWKTLAQLKLAVEN